MTTEPTSGQQLLEARMPTVPPAPDAGHRLDACREADRSRWKARRERCEMRLRRSAAAYAWWDRVLSRLGLGSLVALVLGFVLCAVVRVFAGEGAAEASPFRLLILASWPGLAFSGLVWLGLTALFESQDRALRQYARQNAVDVDDVRTPFHP